MAVLTGGVYLSPGTEAERLWSGAQEAFEQAAQGIVPLSEAIDLGVRVVEITAVQCLREVRHEFPATIASLLDPPPPEVNVERDFLHPPKSLRFIDAVDMLSDMELPCISPQRHHGWEDRVASCRRSRSRAERACGFFVDRRQREELMLLGAYRNRIFLLPPPVRIVTDEVLGAFPTLVELVERLFASARTRVS
jgi:hypothetical protein